MTTTRQMIAAKDLQVGDQLHVGPEVLTVREARRVVRPSGEKVRIVVPGHRAFSLPLGSGVLVNR